MCIVLPQKRLLSLAHEWSGLLLCGAQELLKAGKMQWIPDETSAIASSSYVVRFELHRFELSSSPPHIKAIIDETAIVSDDTEFVTKSVFVQTFWERSYRAVGLLHKWLSES